MTQKIGMDKHWFEIVQIWEYDYRWLYGFAGLLAGFFIGLALSNVIMNWFVWFAGEFWTDALGIAITVIIIDNLNRKRDQYNLQQLLKVQVLSRVEEIAVGTLERMRHEKTGNQDWLTGEKGLLREAHLFDVNWKSANLEKANLEKAFLWEADLQQANMRQARLSNAKLGQANLKNAKLWRANLEGASLLRANLVGTDLSGANLKEANLLEADLQGADLAFANLQSAKLMAANLEGASLAGANLKNIQWSSPRFGAAILPDGTKWTKNTDIAHFTNTEESK